MLGLFVKSLGLVLFIFLKHLNELREICHILVEPFGKNTLCCLFAVASAKDDFMESLSRYLWPPNRKCNGINHGLRLLRTHWKPASSVDAQCHAYAGIVC